MNKEATVKVVVPQYEDFVASKIADTFEEAANCSSSAHAVTPSLVSTLTRGKVVYASTITSIVAEVPVSPMGVTVMQHETDNDSWLIGSFSGLYRWDTSTGIYHSIKLYMQLKCICMLIFTAMVLDGMGLYGSR